MSLAFRILASIAILIQLIIVWTIPNSSSIPGRTISNWVSPYINQLGINSTYRFYAPDPPPTMFIEYEIVKRVSDLEDIEEKEDESDVRTFPEELLGSILQERFNRRVASARWMSSFPGQMEKYFVQWICRRNPEADAVFVRQVIRDVPSVEKSKVEKGNFEELTIQDKTTGQQFACIRGDHP